MLVFLAGNATAQDEGEGPIVNSPPQGMSVEEIIRRFAAKEKQFKQARDQYTYRQTVKVQTLDGDTVDGEFQQVTDIDYDQSGHRLENVVFAPQSSLVRVTMSKEDFDGIRNLFPFVLTSDDLPEYDVLYVGRQKVDELSTYVFDIAPKQIVKGKLYFQGRIWVDDRDLQIVKTSGKTVPEQRGKGQENLFPKFTTWREQVDGVYWFPTYTRADDTLHFSGGKGSFLSNDVHIREIIKYTNYKKFGSNVKITYDGQEIPKGAPLPQTTTQPPAQNPRPPQQ
jgi:hypothetical protein